MEHFVIICDWKDHHEGNIDILGVSHSLDDAKKIFNNVLPKKKELAGKNGFEVINESETYFCAECEEEWGENYTKLYIQKV